MKFLIAGSGSIGRRHVRNLLTLGERDIMLYRTHHGTLDDKELAQLPVETDLQKALAMRPDAVIISNPTSKHMEVALPTAQAGIHMLIEKPVSGSLIQSSIATSWLVISSVFIPCCKRSRPYWQMVRLEESYQFRHIGANIYLIGIPGRITVLVTLRETTWEEALS